MFKSYFRPNMMFHNDNLSTLSAENYANLSKTNIWILPWFSDIIKGTWKFLSKINNRFGFKPGVSIITIAWESTFTSKAVKGQSALQLVR